MMEYDYNALLNKLKNAYPDHYDALVHAYEFAREAHKGQKRASGEDYIIHPCSVVEILLDFGFDASTCIAAFLHDVLEDTSVTPEQLQNEFGSEILELVEGVTKLDKLQFLNREEEQAENFRKIFMAMARDLRVIIIKFADRLHNMRSLEFMPPEKQQYISRETMEIYAPLAGRLGISFFKCELEDLAMKYLYPNEYEMVNDAVKKRCSERKDFLDTICHQIEDKLAELNMHGEVNGRQKHLWSVFKKLKALNITIEQIYDLQAVRIIVDDVKDCYTMLGEVHTMWKPIPGRFKDYIAMPKANNYQSLHTTVVTPFEETFEIQIRTYEMHKIAEYGVAAHWKYKEGTTNVESALDGKVKWLREIMDSQSDISGAQEFMDAIKINVFDDEVFVFTPKGDVFDLPVGSTPVDLAYKIHSEVGNHCIGAKINRKMVPLSTKLSTGDIVEIVTSNASKGPSLDWLKFVMTAQARSRIRSYFKKENKDENVKRGHEMLEREARRRGFNLNELLGVNQLDDIMRRMSVSTLEDMYAALGFGGLTTNQVLIKLIEAYRTAHAADVKLPTPADNVQHKRSKSGVIIGGNADFYIHMAHCCSPVPGDNIVGFISRGRGVSIHRADCPNVKGLQPERLIEAVWDIEAQEKYSATLNITSENKGGILAAITTTIANNNMSIDGAQVKTDPKEHTANIIVTVGIHNTKELDELVNKLMRLDGILHIVR